MVTANSTVGRVKNVGNDGMGSFFGSIPRFAPTSHWEVRLPTSPTKRPQPLIQREHPRPIQSTLFQRIHCGNSRLRVESLFRAPSAQVTRHGEDRRLVLCSINDEPESDGSSLDVAVLVTRCMCLILVSFWRTIRNNEAIRLLRNERAADDLVFAALSFHPSAACRQNTL